MATAQATRSSRKPSTRVTSEILDRMPPQADEAEQMVIGSIMCLPAVLDDLAGVLDAGDFRDNRIGMIYARLQAMQAKGRRIDLPLLIDALRKAGEWTDEKDQRALSPNAELLAMAMNSVATAAHATEYAQMVRRAAIAREAVGAGSRIIQVGHDETLDADELLNRIEEAALQIRDKRGSGRESVHTLEHTLTEALAQLAAREHGDFHSGVAIGFTALDAKLSLRNGELIILAARPSMGKTALALNIARNVAAEGSPVLFCSLEMSRLDLADRLLSSMAKVNLHSMRNGTLSDDKRKRIVEVSGEISRLPVHIDDTPSRSILEIAATARRLKRKGGLGLVVVDYLQLIQPEDRRAPRQEQVAAMAARLKMIARELQVPVLCLAQLNRQSESTADRKPKLSHLRESGAIEQDADVVMFVHREEYYQPNLADVRGIAEINIAKHRNGPTDTVALAWLGEFTSFANLSSERKPF